MLLETRMRYGKISYQANDVVRRADKWKPPDEVEADLMERHKSTYMATVKFISGGNHAYRTVVIDETPCWRMCYMCLVICWQGFIHCMRATWAGFIRCMRATWAWISN